MTPTTTEQQAPVRARVPRAASAFGNAYLFAGRRFDAPTGLYYCRNRYYETLAGRFVSRDPLGRWEDPLNPGNGYAYVGNRTTGWSDPYGLEGEQEDEVRTVFEWFRKFWGTGYRPGRGRGQGLRTPQVRTPLTGIGNQLLTPEGAEAQRGGIEFVRRAQRDKELAGESIYGTYSPLTESGSASPPGPVAAPRPAPGPPAPPAAPRRPARPTAGDVLSPLTRELMDVERQIYVVEAAFDSVGKQFDDLQCIPGYEYEYKALKHRLLAQYFLLRRLRAEMRRRERELEDRIRKRLNPGVR